LPAGAVFSKYNSIQVIARYCSISALQRVSTAPRLKDAKESCCAQTECLLLMTQSPDFTGADANGSRKKLVPRFEIYSTGRQDIVIKDSRLSLDASQGIG